MHNRLRMRIQRRKPTLRNLRRHNITIGASLNRRRIRRRD
jgi:hypothetical protein